MFKKISLLFLLLSLPIFSFGADYFPKENFEESSQNVVISGEEINENFYTAGSNVVLNTKVNGDFFGAGGTININSEVSEDLFILAGNINISAPVLGDVRVLGGNINISSNINGDLVVLGGTVVLGDKTLISGDVWILGGVINISGNLNKNLKILGGEVYLNGSVLGNVELKTTENVVFAEKSIVSGSITHKGYKPATIKEGAQIPTISFTKDELNKKEAQNAFMFFNLAGILGLFLGVYILLRFFKKRVALILEKNKGNFWQNVLIGFLFFFFAPFAILFLILSVVGTFVGFFFLALSVILIMLSILFSILEVGNKIQKFIFKRKKETQKEPVLDTETKEATEENENKEEAKEIKNEMDFGTIILGLFILVFLSIIPFFGSLVIFVIVLSSLGLLLKTAYLKVIKIHNEE